MTSDAMCPLSVVTGALLWVLAMGKLLLCLCGGPTTLAMLTFSGIADVTVVSTPMCGSREGTTDVQPGRSQSIGVTHPMPVLILPPRSPRTRRLLQPLLPALSNQPPTPIPYIR